MAFKGSKKRPSSLLIASAIDAIGGEFNAFTSKDHTGFYIKARVSHVPLLIDVLSDMILRPILAPVEIEREKGVIIEEIHMYEDTPIRHIGDVYEDLLYGDHPLGWDTAGKPKIIRSIKRENFLEYMRALYCPNNAVLVVAGGIKNRKEAVTELVGKHFQSWKKAPIWQWKKASDNQSKPQVKLEYKATEQAHLALGVRAYHLLHPKRFALNVLNSILGGGMSSRLFIQVRERRGLAYYVHSSIDQYLDVGTFVTQAGVDVKRIDEAIKVMIHEYMGIADRTERVTEEELKKGKEYIKGRLTLEFEDSRDVAGFYSTQEILRRSILTPEEVIAKTDAVTIKDVEGVAKDIFDPKKLNLAIIGPFKEEDKFLKIFK